MTTPATLALPAAPDGDTESADKPPQRATRPPRPPEYPPRGTASRRVAALTVGLVVWWQLVVLVGIQYGGWATWQQITAAIACGLVLIASAVRWRGRWLIGWLVTYLWFRHRVRSTAAAPVSPLTAAGADPQTRSHTDRAGNLVGLARDGDCWTSLLRIAPAPGTEPDAARDHIADMLPLLIATHDDRAVPTSAVQLVTWAAPLTVHTATPPAMSEAEGATRPVAVQRLHWVAVRFAPQLAATAVAARGGGEAGAMRATAAATLRLAARLTEAGYTVDVCDGQDLSTQLAIALGVPATPTVDASQSLSETWHAWSVGALHQGCYRLRRAPRTIAAMAAAANRVAAAPALFTGASILLERSQIGEVVSQVLLRVGVPAGPDATEQREALDLAAAGLGGDTVRLDGAHGTAVAATVPLGRRAHL